VTAPEFSRPIDERHVTPAPIKLTATADECTALARRFGIVAIKRLDATVKLERNGEALVARGRLRAAIVQSCAVSGDDLPVKIDEPLAFRFMPEAKLEGDEIELDATDLDEIPFEGHVFDLGEAVAQSLALAIDPYAVGPNAERVRQEAGLENEASSGPFAPLAALKKD
jgi:uncharacterized metal-binding protein YceD (DUF177 family)